MICPQCRGGYVEIFSSCGLCGYPNLDSKTYHEIMLIKKEIKEIKDAIKLLAEKE